MNSLFETAAPRPLADLLRPSAVGDIVGQDHLLKPSGVIGRMLANRRLSSMILWGPPGVGKTTLARIMAAQAGMAFETISAVTNGLPDLRKVLEAAAGRRKVTGRNTVLLVDEIHRWNRNVQDTLLPYVEDGTVTLIGATTDNPSMEINGALLSRAPVYQMRRLETDSLELLLQRAEAHTGWSLPLDPDARAVLLGMADGDGRYLLNLCEGLFDLPTSLPLSPEELMEAVQRRAVSHDKSGDGHYGLLSALQKSIRGSDVDAALFYLARLIRGGEPPKAIFRRLAVMATEEIGLCDPSAIQHTLACAEAFERIGAPEGLPALAQCVGYLATCPKSNAIYSAFYKAMELAEAHGSVEPPKHILNAPTRVMKELGYKEGYRFDHDFPDAFSGQEFFPSVLAGAARPGIYAPNERGNEREILKRMAWWAKERLKRSKD